MSIQVVFDRFENGQAVLRLEGQEIVLPKSALPEGSKEGATFFLLLAQAPSKEEERTQLAKTLLNEILQGRQS